MKKLSTIIILTVLIFTGCSSANGLSRLELNEDGTFTGKAEIETREYDIVDFKSLEISNDIDVKLKYASKYKVEVTTNADVFDKLSIEKISTTLSAANKENIVLKDTRVSMTISMPNIESISLHNDSDLIMIDSFNNLENLIVTLTNDSTLLGDIKSKSLQAKLASDTKLTLSGSTDSITLSAKSDSKANLEELKGKKATITLLSDAICNINVDGNIELTSSSSPTLNIYSGKLQKHNVSEDTKLNFMK